jgi:hypothetical protein
MPLLSGFSMRPHGNFSTSGLSEICKIRKVWKLPSPFSRNTLIPCSEMFFWSGKSNSKMAMKRLPCKSLNFMIFRHPSKKSQNYGTFTFEKFSWPFLKLLDNFSSKTMFLNSKKSFQSLRSEYSLRTDLEVSTFKTFLIL